METERYIWNFFPSVPLMDITLLSRKLGVHPVVSKILLQKQYDLQKSREFLDSNLDKLSSPYLFKDMGKAVSRIVQAIENNEKIRVYGDYDADGVCATAVMQLTLQQLGANVVPVIPNRLTEGYGLTEEVIHRFARENVNLIITVDNGIKSFDEVKLANQLDIDVIITDHHICDPQLPEALAVLNPFLESEMTPFAGCGVAFQLSRALEMELGGFNALELMDIVAIGTYADIVPIIKDNRIIVIEGLKLISGENHAGITALLNTAGRKPKLIGELDLGFILGPRLNSAGRIGKAEKALELLSVKNDINAAMIFARELESYNDWRKIKMEDIERQATAMIEEKKEIPYGIVLMNQDWHLGVIGLGASKLAELYNRPSILLKDLGGYAKGSGRSPVKEFNLIEVLDLCSSLLDVYGGHSQAVGLTINIDNVPAFKQEFNRYSKTMFKNIPSKQTINISGEFLPSYDDFKLITDLKKLSPFGLGNEKPLFLARKVSFVDPREVGSGHLKAQLITNKGRIDCIGFNLSYLIKDIKQKPQDVVYSLRQNNWNNRTTIQVNIVDVRPSE